MSISKGTKDKVVIDYEKTGDIGEKSRTGKRGRPTNVERLERQGKVEGNLDGFLIGKTSESLSSEMIDAIKTLTQEVREMKREMKEDRETLKAEIKTLREELREKEIGWERERIELNRRIERVEREQENRQPEREIEQTVKHRISEIENKISEQERDRNSYARLGTEELHRISKAFEEQEKKNRKNNVIIRGLKGEFRGKKEEVEKFFKDNLEVDVKVESAIQVGKDVKIIIAKINSWEEKQDIMKNKKKLGNTKIYIDHDLTRTERVIQSRLVIRAKREREKGRVVKIGYKKICIEGEWIAYSQINWSESNENF